MEIKLLCATDSPPLSVIAAAEIAGILILVDPSLPSGSVPSFVFSNGLKVYRRDALLRYIGRAASRFNLYGKDPFAAGQIDMWLDYLPILDKGSEFEAGCSFLDTYLLTNTFLVGSDVSIADIFLWAALAGIGHRWESLRKSNKKYQNLIRWYNSLSSEYTILDDIVGLYSSKRGGGKPISVKLKDQDSQNESQNSSRPEIDLPDAEVGKVCLRFAPEPSGYLHIGHSKAALLNKYFAEKYKGRLILRFDDTNPAKESNEFVENILNDIKTLGIFYDTITYTSDYFPQLMEMAENFIKQGKAYVDDTSGEQLKEERKAGVESKNRNNSVEKNLELWKEMIASSDEGLMCCLRGKLDMKNENKSLRDPVYYRCNPIPHHRTGSKYKLYPTYDFACPFVDSVEGITHALRSNEYHDRNAQYHWVQRDMGLRKVHLYEFSRMNMVYTVLSKRKLLWFVQNGRVDGWDDPRFPTIQGILRGGLKVEALILFIFEQGASKNINLMEWDKLWGINKRIIDPVCPRHTAVIDAHRVMVTLADGPEQPFVRVIPRHKKYEGAGEKCMTYTKNIWIDHVDAEAVRNIVPRLRQSIEDTSTLPMRK